MTGTHNPHILLGLDGRRWVSYGSTTCRVAELLSTGRFGPERTIGPGGGAWPIRPGVCTFVDNGRRLEMAIGTWTPLLVETIPAGVPFQARDGHWLVTKPAAKEIIRDQQLIARDAVQGELDGDRVWWITASHPTTINCSDAHFFEAPFTVGRHFVAVEGELIFGSPAGAYLQTEDGTDCTMAGLDREGSLRACRWRGQLWIATGVTLDEAPYIVLRPKGERHQAIWIAHDPADLDLCPDPDTDALIVVSGPATKTHLVLTILTSSQLTDRPTPGVPEMPTFENKYSDLVHVAETSPNWHDAINPTLSEGQRLDACMAFINECAYLWNEEDDVAAGKPGSYGKLWRASKNSYSDDCIAVMGSDGTLYESDCIKNAGGTDAVLQWMTPSPSKWAYHAPTEPDGGTSPGEPGPEPGPEPEPGDDMHFAINEDLTSRALDELDALNKKHWLVDRAPNPSISRYIFGVYEPNMQKELNAIGHLPGDPATWEAMHNQSVELFTQQLYADHHGAVVPGEPVPAPDEDFQ